MNHAEATKTLAVEQYLLGELTEAKQEEFEEHFFTCTDCAAALENGALLVANTKAALREPEAVARQAAVRERRKWFAFPGWGFAPAAALAGCAILAVITGYQNLVEIPAMRQGGLALAPALAVRAARAPQDLTFSKKNGIATLTIAHEWEESYSRYQGEMERAADHSIVSKAELAATPGDITVAASVQPLPTGSYFLNLYGLREGSAERMAVARVPFTLTE